MALLPPGGSGINLPFPANIERNPQANPARGFRVLRRYNAKRDHADGNFATVCPTIRRFAELPNSVVGGTASDRYRLQPR